MNAPRAFAQRGRWFTDGPDFIAVPCAHCKLLVESLDRRGLCDDCGADRLVVAHREVAVTDFAVALDLGAFSFARRAAAQLERDLAADEAYSEWCDARRDAAYEVEARRHAPDAAEVDARAEALRAQAVAAEVAAWAAHDDGNDLAARRHGARAERFWTERERATLLSAKIARREVA